MPRTYFRKANAGDVLVSGIAVSSLQEGLNALSIVNIVADGIYGSNTRDAVKAYQTSTGLPPTGEVDDATWRSLMRSDEPAIFARCLQVTAHFEGTGFERCVGNFDGAGLTWGIIGFTLSNGELGAVLKTINATVPNLLSKAFGSDAKTIMEVVALPAAERVAWGNSVSRGPNNMAVAEPWRTYLHDLGTYREVQLIQMARARDVYWAIATRDADNLAMHEESDYALLHDVAVQNGGMESKGRRKTALQEFAKLNPDTPAGRRRIVTETVVATSKPVWQADVRSRKAAISDGRGTVHGGKYVLEDWGIMAGVTPLDRNA